MRDSSRGWLLTAIGVSAALILGAPFIGQLRAFLREWAGTQFAMLMAILVFGAIGLAMVYALVRIKGQWQLRYAALAVALAIGIGYGLVSRTGNADVDAVERFHFVEYGLITALFYRAFRPAADGTLLIVPILAGLIVGTLEEWLQWFIPVRVGEVRDVLLNGFAIGCGLLFSLGLDPPPRVTWTLAPGSRRRVSLLAAAALVTFGAFMHSVHLGYEIKDQEAGVFRSRYTSSELMAISAERAQRWKRDPPVTWSRLSREDQYFSEGVAHVQRRNETWQANNAMASRHENLILEKYYAPVLDTPSYLSATGHRWPASQRADAESRVGPGFMIYDSDALPYPIFLWPKWAFWTVIGLLVLMTLRGVRTTA
jgi:hypothetical protein